jgi:hypothetical protein
MKGLILGVALAATATAAQAQYQSSYGTGLYGTGSNPSSTYHQGYVTQQGTYVQPHYQTRSNNTQLDNYGTRGNVNPYTGVYGTRRPRY